MALIDGDGAFHHWKYPGAYVDQPWIDMQVYREIRQANAKHQNDRIDRDTSAVKRGMPRGRVRRRR